MCMRPCFPCAKRTADRGSTFERKRYARSSTWSAATVAAEQARATFSACKMNSCLRFFSAAKTDSIYIPSLKVHGTTVLSMSPCYDKMFRMTSLYICMFIMSIISILFAVISGVLMGADFSSVDDWFLFRSLTVISLFYLVTHAFSASLLPLFLVAEYLPVNAG